jgi:hypothetical protein
MITIIIILVIFAVLWFTKSFWANFLIKIFKKQPSARDISSKAVIFSPSGTTRTFVVAINLTETGDGKVEMSLEKLKQKDVEKN